jgi:hypothetical protein
MNDPLSKDEKTALLNLKKKEDIIITRPDKGGGTVILNKSDYMEKLRAILSDTNKFQECKTDQRKKLKSDLNNALKSIEIIDKYLYKDLTLTGEYENGHFYGLPKIHKNSTDPPLRPVISMVGTPSHKIAKFLNDILKEYLNEKYIIKSSNELILNFNNLSVSSINSFYSLDVESLFTNVPVHETIKIILDETYRNSSHIPPSIPENTIRELLLLCTTKTPFQFDGKTYLQVDGVSMGSPLGPLFANFYMSHLENKVLSQNLSFKPSFYVRYVDDTLAVFNSFDDLLRFIECLKSNSCLNFTYESPITDNFNFLDVNFRINMDSKIETSIYTKPTDTGQYFDYSSYLPDCYKKSLIKTLIYRAYNLCSTWTTFDKEVKRITQNLIDNNFPQSYIEKTINKTLDKLYKNTPSQQEDITTLYFNCVNANEYKKDKKLLNDIANTHIKKENGRFKISIYYKPRKLSSNFTTRPKKPMLEQHNVVYKFACIKESCEASYIGHTSNTVSTRAKQHKYSSSKICEHFKNEHDEKPDDGILNGFHVLYRNSSIRHVKIAEAIYIKRERPFINVKYNEMSSGLHIF